MSHSLVPTRKVAERIVMEILHLPILVHEIDIAGSIRRERPFVGDIDLVIKLEQKSDITAVLQRMAVNCKLIKNGEQYVVFEMSNGLQIDLWFAHPAIPAKKDMFGVVEVEAQPSNYGSLLLCRTGSKEHNIFIAQRAQSLGMSWQTSRGIVQAGRVIASETEQDIFKALNLDYIAPERRER